MSKQSERKKKRRAKRNGHKKSPKKLNSSLNDLAREIGKIMDKMGRDRKFFNKKAYCKKCKEFYCQGADNVDAYCLSCFYSGCCQKELEYTIPCKYCS